MRLKRLEIQGYKSFATKTAFEFAAMMVASNPFAGAFRPA